AQIVAIERDVEGAYRRPLAFDTRNLLGDARGQCFSARLDAHQGEIGAARLLHDLVADASEGTVEPGLVQHLRLLAKRHAATSPSLLWGEGRVRGLLSIAWGEDRVRGRRGMAGQKKCPAPGWA